MFELNQEWLCKEYYIMDNKEIAFIKGNNYKVIDLYSKKSAVFISEVSESHNMDYDTEFTQYFELVNNYIKIPLSEIKNCKSDKELAELVRSIAENY